jgi:hypothetical protein
MGHPQVRGRTLEPPIVTSGNALERLAEYMPEGASYTAADVITMLLAAP